LSLLLSENIPEKSHGVYDARQLFQNGILGISQVDGIAYGSRLKVTVDCDTHRINKVSPSKRAVVLLGFRVGC
jgi:hypothetical protein